MKANKKILRVELRQSEDANERTRESASGRVYTSRSPLIQWTATAEGEDIPDIWSSWKTAERDLLNRYPNAKVILS